MKANNKYNNKYLLNNIFKIKIQPYLVYFTLISSIDMIASHLNSMKIFACLGDFAKAFLIKDEKQVI